MGANTVSILIFQTKTSLLPTFVTYRWVHKIVFGKSKKGQIIIYIWQKYCHVITIQIKISTRS